ncbi:MULTISPECIES: glycosyltransferase family 4 protein [Nostoc]|uniref:Glycosyltransferase family 4 protein n=1 Tax=Nostoc paludosum FACHB-159 TaxID=2692908 RepID=A0ABR8K1K3_9NOSO|nr:MULTISPECIES: glycosyltransferase family 4 protein [Nostoc]MBD2676354.1 glycosyltransferase family 4 protein [Nostoc sp. FACHB-857]MBD2732518.1 glycosyltransferase family 4 protein [Nostoc paludosum FACHB-159]
MKILLINHSDISGGASRAAYRLHQGLQGIAAISQLLTQEKYSDDKTVLAPEFRLSQGIARAKQTFDALPLKFYGQRTKTTFSLQWLPDRVVSKVTQINPDIINLHWINSAFMQIETIAKFKRPIVWTIHDMWAFTGGCHYSGECDRYTASCGSCPQLGSTGNLDLSHWVWQRKTKAWRDLNLTIISPSVWLAKCAKSSSLFKDLRIEVIPNGLDTQVYRPIQKSIARQLLNLPQDKQLILFGSLQATSDNRKGFYLLQPALQELTKSGWQDRLELVIFGSLKPDNPPEFGFKAHYLGTLNDDLSLALLYSAADVFVLPSIQENLANTMVEAISCGTPCVAFRIGGMSDIIEHQKNGYLAQPYKLEDLAQGIAWVLENQERHQNLCVHARKKAEKEFTITKQAHHYSSLFTNILESGKDANN